LRAVVKSVNPKFGYTSHKFKVSGLVVNCVEQQPTVAAFSTSKSVGATALTSSKPDGPSPAQTQGSRRDVLDFSFNDAHAAYKSKTTWEILRAYIVYTLCSSNYLVENNMKVRSTVQPNLSTRSPSILPKIPLLMMSDVLFSFEAPSTSFLLILLISIIICSFQTYLHRSDYNPFRHE